MAAVRSIARLCSQLISAVRCCPSQLLVWWHVAVITVRLRIWRLVRRGRPSEARQLSQLVNGVIPARVERIRFRGVRDTLLAGDGTAFAEEIAAMNSRCEQLTLRSGTPDIAELLNRTVVLLIDQPERRRRKCLSAAVDLVAEFREEFRQPVPAVHRLAIELAKAERMGMRTLCIYREFLACSGFEPESAQYRMVEKVYRRAMDPGAGGKKRRRKA